MGLVVPDAAEVEIVTTILTPALTLRLYGNNRTPSHGDTVAGYTEIAGGGYANKPLVLGGWTITSGEPTSAAYTTQTWTFTGVINAPGSIYGYYVTRNSDGKLMWAERFPAGNVPFSPVAGSVIRILPKYSVQSQF